MNKEHYCTEDKCKCPKCGSALFYDAHYKGYACSNIECEWYSTRYIWAGRSKAVFISTSYHERNWIRDYFLKENKMHNYEIDQKMGKQIENNFKYHSPTQDQSERYVYLRDKAKELAYDIIKNTPPSREQALAITNLEQAIFWANAAIARNEGNYSFNSEGDKNVSKSNT